MLVTAHRVFVGITERTNADGARQLATHVASFGFETIPVAVTECGSGKERLLINPVWIDPKLFEGFDVLDIDPAEPMAANVLVLADRVVCAEEHPRTRRRLEGYRFVTLSVPAGELAKAEGGLTCCAVFVPNHLTFPR